MSLIRTSTRMLALRIITALALICGVSWWFFTVAWSEVYVRPEADARDDARDSLALSYSTGAISTVTQLYGRVLAGEPDRSTQMLLAPGAENALNALVERHASGALARYVIMSADLPSDYDTLDLPGSQPSGQVEMLVMVEEYARGSNDPTIYECLLVETWYSFGSGGATSDGFLLRSIRLLTPTPPG